MNLDVGCSFVFDVPVATHAVMLFEPQTSEGHRVIDSTLELTAGAPPKSARLVVDGFANRCRRVTFEAGRAAFRFMARVDVGEEPDDTFVDAMQVRPDELPSDVLQFLLPSRYCESDLLAALAWETFGDLKPGWARAQGISDWVHDRLAFRYGSSSPSHSALTAINQGEGVCRDFTHLAIALCRALTIPARYVCGYLPDIGVADPGSPMDFCAWMEVFLDGRWFTFDPRNNERRIGRVVIGRGRDAADVAMVTSYGNLKLLEMTVRAELGCGSSWKDAASLGPFQSIASDCGPLK